jgi:hypothetical protein
MSSGICSHLESFKLNNGLNSYRVIYKQFIAVSNEESRKLKVFTICLFIQFFIVYIYY